MIPSLNKGDTIAFYTPSSPITALCPKRFKRAKNFLRQKDFNLRAGSLTGQKDAYRSGSIKERVDELNELIRDPKVKCIMSTIGGANSNSLLPYIDYDHLKRHPKILIGYSDVTAILLAVYAQTGLATFYGPALVASFGELAPFVEQTYFYFHQICMSQSINTELYKPTIWTDEYIPWEEQSRAKEERINQWKILSEGKATGRLIGGNLSTMMGSWGSEYMPKIEEGDILLIEDSLKPAAIVERNFAFLKVNGIFDKIGGLLLGKHELFNDQDSGKKHYEILQEVMGKTNYDYPIIAEFDCCHTHPMMTLPIGANISIDTQRDCIRINEAVVL